MTQESAASAVGACPSKSAAARYANGVQTFLPCARTAEELRADRRRAARQIGLLRMERECRTVVVGARRVKAWRVAGTAEFVEHARLVARLAAEFSGLEACG